MSPEGTSLTLLTQDREKLRISRKGRMTSHVGTSIQIVGIIMSMYSFSLGIIFGIQIIGGRTIFGTISPTLDLIPINTNNSKKAIKSMYPIELNRLYIHQRLSPKITFILVHLTMHLRLF
ncbi:hypothetical protein FKM82_006129 [Ascaphus truei]